MSGSALPLLARLGEAGTFPQAVRNYESDAWVYLRRKLEDCAGPLRAYKAALFAEARGRLLADLKDSFLKPGALMDHKETFEKLLSGGDFADLSYNLSPGVEPTARREAIAEVLTHARIKTLFDTEALPPERRGKPWEALVAEAGTRLNLDILRAMLDRAPRTERRRNYIARRARRNLKEYLTVTSGEQGLREEITLFVLTRVEATIAAMLRFLNAP